MNNQHSTTNQYELKELGFLALVVPLSFLFAVIATGAFASVVIETLFNRLKSD